VDQAESDLWQRVASHWALPLISLPESDSFQSGFIFCCGLFSFFSPRDLRAPLADHRKILHVTRKCVQFYNPVPKFCSPPKKNFKKKNMQNLARFLDNFKNQRRISPEWMKIFFKIEQVHIYQDSSRILYFYI